MPQDRNTGRERGSGKRIVTSRVLITGGAGFIGYHLAKKLSECDYSVHLVDNYARGFLDNDLQKLLEQSKVTLSEVDLLDQTAVLNLGSCYNAVFHLGAIIGVQNVLDRPYNVLVDNIRMLDNVITLARQQTSLSRLLFASSSEVYAGTLKHFTLAVPTPESTALTVSALSEPRTSYMLSKLVGEAMLQQAGVPFTIFRPHNVYGPRMGMAHVIPEQLKQAFYSKVGGRLNVHSPQHTRVFCYIDDAVEMLQLMLESDLCIGETLNLGNQSPELSIRELVEICISVSGKELGINELAPTVGSPIRRAPDMNRTENILDLSPNVSLYDGIERTWWWYRKHMFESDGLVAR